MSARWDTRTPTSSAEAIDIIEHAMLVVYDQVLHYRGERKKAWDGSFVDHVREEANRALAWLKEREPPAAD